jgi:hypothetical protein
VFVLPFEQKIVMYYKFHLFQETVSMMACINVLNVDGNHKRKLQVSSDNAKQKYAGEIGQKPLLSTALIW